MSNLAEKAAPAAKTNRIGLTRDDYKGGKSTLCPGCGHDAISNHIIQACYDAGIDPFMMGKFSGIGCSSKTPAYFINKAHAVNAVHGRMPSVATGALMANHKLVSLAVSGDGDTASIGIGQFIHMVRRNVNTVYLVENNGVYGLTKGQFSATADEGSVLKTGAVNLYEAIDVCALALELGCGFVARSFSGDKKQVVPLIQAALSYQGTAVIDIISPCVTFNNHEGSTRSYDQVKEHEAPLHDIDYISHYDPISVDYAEGSAMKVEMHDGSLLSLKKLGRDYDPTDRAQAMQLLEAGRLNQEFVTGLLYFNPAKKSLDQALNLGDETLNKQNEAALRMSPDSFQKLMDSFR